MKKITIKSTGKYSLIRRVSHILLKVRYILPAAILLMFPGCDSDEVGDAYYTFTGETVGDYISNRPESFSEFADILELTGVMGLLNAYGKYTLFLPDNNAMVNFYQSRGKSSMSDFPIDTLKKIIYDHIIKDFIVSSDDFVDGFLPNLTMSGRYLKISFEPGEGSLIYRVNATSTIIVRDIELHNGIVHTINVVLSPTENTLVEAIARDEKYSLFFEALMATGLDEKLMPIKDESYDPGSLAERDGEIDGIGGTIRIPMERKFGFTALMESNATYADNGINNLDNLKAYAKQVYDNIYPEDADITDVRDRKNSLNRFVAYHLINKKLSNRLFIEKYDNTGWYYESRGETHSIKTQDMFEYIETMCPNTLIEVRTWRKTNEYNVFNMIDEENNEAIRLTDDFDNDALNGVYHEIDNILEYSTDVDRLISSKRLRMDAASFFPEFTNNNIRVGHASPDWCSERWFFPKGYIDRVTTSETTEFGYINADDRFCDYQGDEIWMVGLYDFEIITPPIPAGTYEVRFGYQPTIFRGAAQLYWDGVPTGIPLDLRPLATDPEIGYVTPGTDPSDPNGYENDKMMRNRGYMKAPASFKVINTAWYSGASARMSPSALRRILGIYTFSEAGSHTFTVKAIRSGEFMFDYLEFVPIEVLEYEDIY